MPELPESFPWHFGGYTPADGLDALEGTELAWVESHCEQGTALLLHQFRDKPRLEAALCALLGGVQDLHDAIWQVLTERWLDTAVGVQLDLLGGIVDLPRRGWADEPYRQLLRARILALRSDGTRAALLAIVAALGFTLTLVVVTEHPPAAVVYALGEPFDVDGLTADDAFLMLDYARSATVRLDLEYPTVAADESFTWADGDAEQADTSRGWADDAETYGGYWADVTGG